MSTETLQWLNQNVLVGYRGMRKQAWHYSASDQGAEPNHYDGPVPIADIRRRLFGWTAERRDVFVAAPGGSPAGSVVRADAHVAIVRSDTNEVLGIRGARYAVHQYEEALLSAVERLLDDNLNIGSAGLLSGGGIAWVQIEAPENCVAAGEVEFRPHLLATTSHNGMVATTYKRVATIVVCDNTLAMALREGGSSSGTGVYKVKHTKDSALKVLDARAALGIIFEMSERFKDEIESLLAIGVSEHEWSRFLEAHIPIAEKDSDTKITNAKLQRHAYNDLWTQDERVSPWRGTAFGVLQAVNTYRHHLRPLRGTTNRYERNKLGAIFGSGAKEDKKALSTLLAIVG